MDDLTVKRCKIIGQVARGAAAMCIDAVCATDHLSPTVP